MRRGRDNLTKRKSVRRGYVHRQLIADYDGCRVPIRSAFYWVTTKDICPEGIAFMSPRKPRTEFLVVSLNPGGACLIARVAWAFCRTDLPGKPYEFGCEFVARLA